MLEKFKIRYDDHGHAFINAKDVYDALEVKSVGFKTWWKDMTEDTGFRKSFDFIIENKKIYVTPEMAKYFCREWNIQTAHKNDCAVEIRRGYQISDLVEATEYFAKSECLSECVGCDEGIINAIRSQKKEIDGEYKPFNYKGKDFGVFILQGQPFFIAEEICEILGISNVAEVLDHIDKGDKFIQKFPDKEVTGINEDGLFSLAFFSKSQKAQDFYIWFVRDVRSQLGAKNNG